MILNRLGEQGLGTGNISTFWVNYELMFDSVNNCGFTPLGDGILRYEAHGNTMVGKWINAYTKIGAMPTWKPNTKYTIFVEMLKKEKRQTKILHGQTLYISQTTSNSFNLPANVAIHNMVEGEIKKIVVTTPSVPKTQLLATNGYVEPGSDYTFEIRCMILEGDWTNSNIEYPGISPEVVITPTLMEIDWTQSMNQTFEYYEVDPNTWKDKNLLKTVKNCSINRNSESNTLGSAAIDVVDMLGESYIRIYLIANQNGVTKKIPLGLFLVQTPSSSFDGKVRSISMDAYTPLLELSEKPVPLGYALLEGTNIMQSAYQIVRNYGRAPVVETKLDKVLDADFISNVSDTWLTYVMDLIKIAKYELNLDEMGKVLFEPKRKIEELQPVWTFTDDNSSILSPEIGLTHDLYGIPNVVEVVCSTGLEVYTSRVENNNINSPTSIQNRGREIIHRDTSPSFSGIPTREQIDEYAETLLKTLSSLEYEVSYSHGYCPVRVGDCVRLNYKKAGLVDVKAKIISQNIRCGTGCSVSERAVFTKNLWK